MSLVMTGPKLQFIGPGRGDQVGYGSGSSKGFAEGAEDSGDPGGSAESEGTEGSEGLEVFNDGSDEDEEELEV